MTISYGHGISVNAIQLLTGVGAIVNHGMLREPTLLKREPGEVPDGIAGDLASRPRNNCAS